MNFLIDRCGRIIDYLRISVTDRCNLRCLYCMPEGGVPVISHDQVLRYEEILKIIDEASLLGVKRFRITGGEPLVRKGILCFLERLSEARIPYSITTNGVLLGQYAADLGRAGLERVNIGLDTLDRERYARITRVDALDDVLRGIDAIRETDCKVKINVVPMRGINEDEIPRFIEWGLQEKLEIRFIEFMPFYGEDRFVSLKPYYNDFRKRYDAREMTSGGGGPARTLSIDGDSCRVGFIMPRTEPFCEECNRLRLTSDGILLPCLFSRRGINLRDPLRRGEPIAPLLYRAVQHKPVGHSLDMRLTAYGMHQVGG